MLGKKQIVLLSFLYVLCVLFFSILIIQQQNDSAYTTGALVLFPGLVTIFMLIFLAFQGKLQYPKSFLVFLMLWGLIHMAGGAIIIDGSILYNYVILPLSNTLPVLKYDQLAHVFGFFTGTLLMFYILKSNNSLPPNINWSLGLIIVAAGSGLGSWNEVAEFIAQATFEAADVGGYVNSSLDMVFNIFGALLAILFIKWNEAISEEKQEA